MSTDLNDDASGGPILRLMLDVARDFNTSRDFLEVAKIVMNKVMEVTRAERGALFWLDDQGEPEFKAGHFLDQQVVGHDDFSTSRTLIAQVIENCEPVLRPFHGIEPTMRSIMVVPISFHSQVRGLIYVDQREKAGKFREENLDLLNALALQAAAAMEGSRHSNIGQEITLALKNIEAQDEATRAQLERVGESVTQEIAAKKRLPEGI